MWYILNHDIIRIFNGVSISSSPCDIVVNHDIIRIFNKVRISSSPCDIAINHDIIRILNEVRISSSPCDIVINHYIVRICNEVSLIIDIKKRKCSRNCIHACSYVEDFDIIMIYQTITVTVCSSLLHEKIT